MQPKQLKIIKLTILNLVIVMAGILLFSKGFFNVTTSAVKTIISSVLLFTGFSAGNYFLLTDKTLNIDDNMLDLATGDELMKALKNLTENPHYGQQCKDLILQYETFKKKKAALLALSGGHDWFDQTTRDVEHVVIANMQKSAKLIAIIDASSVQSDIDNTMTRMYSCIDRNNDLLSKYNNLLIEASQMNDTELENQTLISLTEIVNTLKGEPEPEPIHKISLRKDDTI